MSFHSWLQKFHSALGPDGGQSLAQRRTAPQARMHRPHLEILEDRRTLSLVLVSISEVPPEGPIEWSPAANWATVDFSGDGHLDLFTAEHQYWEYSTLVQVALGQPTGGYFLWQSEYLNIYPTGVGIGDFYLSNGTPDVVIAGYDQTYGTFGYWVLLNDGDWGPWGPPPPPPPPTGPSFSIDDATVTESNAGQVAATFHVSLSAPSSEPITVAYSTADGSAGYGNDYVAASGTLTFAPGETVKPVTVQVIGDTTFESDETLGVYLSGATGATIADGKGVGTIVNDDVALPSLTVSDVSKKEGNNGTTDFRFTVTLSAPSHAPVTVQYATADGTATVAGRDYDAKSGTLTFQQGQISKTITVQVRGDRTREAHETFFLNLANGQGATIADGQGLCTIQNDDGGTLAALINDLALSQSSRKRR